MTELQVSALLLQLAQGVAAAAVGGTVMIVYYVTAFRVRNGHLPAPRAGMAVGTAAGASFLLAALVFLDAVWWGVLGDPWRAGGLAAVFSLGLVAQLLVAVWLRRRAGARD